ncbi:hypothetical protein ABIA35_006024 [Catenulispora sp. MAP12-49]
MWAWASQPKTEEEARAAGGWASAAWPSPDDKRASVVERTESGRKLAARVKEVWC